MLDLQREGSRVVTNPVRQPLSLDELEGRVRRRRHRRQGRAAAGLAAVVVLVGVLTLTQTGSSHGRQVTTETAPPTSVPTAEAPLPAGWVRVNYGNASLGVPADWLDCFGSIDSTVLERGDNLGYGGIGYCPDDQSYEEPYVEIGLDQQQRPTGRPVEINGHAGVVEASRAPASGAVTYWFADLGVTVTISAPEPAEFINTIGWSASYLILHPARPAVVPLGWKPLDLDDVHLEVPAAWPVVHLAPAAGLNPGGCGPPEFREPSIYLGYNDVSPACPLFEPVIAAGVDGIWLRPYSAEYPASGSSDPQLTLLRTADPAVWLVAETGFQPQPVLTLVVQASPGDPKVLVDIGIGPQPAVAQEILASIAGS